MQQHFAQIIFLNAEKSFSMLLIILTSLIPMILSVFSNTSTDTIVFQLSYTFSLPEYFTCVRFEYKCLIMNEDKSCFTPIPFKRQLAAAFRPSALYLQFQRYIQNIYDYSLNSNHNHPFFTNLFKVIIS